MTRKPSEQKRSADLAGAEIAMHRAAKRARRIAEETGTLELFTRLQELGASDDRVSEEADQSTHPPAPPSR